MEDKDLKQEDKVLYKGVEMTPQEFVERMEIDTKKKERNAESIARQKLLERQEEENNRKAIIEATINVEGDANKEDALQKYQQQKDAPVDMSMYQVNLPFDVQAGPDLQLGPFNIQASMSPIPSEEEYRLGGLMSLMDDSKIDSFKKGGKKCKEGYVWNDNVKACVLAKHAKEKSSYKIPETAFQSNNDFKYEKAPEKNKKASNKTEVKKENQKAFDKDFKVNSKKTNYDVVADKIQKNKDNYLKQLKESTIKIPEERVKQDLEDIEKSGWKLYGKVGEQRPEATIKSFTPEKPQGFMDKAVDIISNPMTSAGFLARGQNIPDYMQRDMDRGTFGYYSNGTYHTERNPLDIAIGDITGLSLANDLREVKTGIEKGDISQAGWGLFAAVPGVGEAKKAVKGTVKNAANVSDEVLQAYNKAVDLKKQGLIKELPETAEGFDDWLKKQYNKRPLYRVVDVNPAVVNDPAFREQMKKIGKNPDNPYEVAEYMGTTPAPSDVVNRGRRSGGHDELLKNTNKDILYYAEDPEWIGKRYGGENPFYVKVFADPLPENIMDQVLKLRSTSRSQKNYSRNFPGFDMNNVPHGVLFEDQLLSVGNNTITPIVGDKGRSVRKVVNIVSGSDFERLPNKRFDLGGLMDLIDDNNITKYKKSKKK